MFGNAQRDAQIADLMKKVTALTGEVTKLRDQAARSNRYGPDMNAAVDRLVAGAGPELQRLLREEVLPQLKQDYLDGDLATTLAEGIDVETLAEPVGKALWEQMKADPDLMQAALEAFAEYVWDNYETDDFDALVAEKVVERLEVRFAKPA